MSKCAWTYDHLSGMWRPGCTDSYFYKNRHTSCPNCDGKVQVEESNLGDALRPLLSTIKKFGEKASITTKPCRRKSDPTFPPGQQATSSHIAPPKPAWIGKKVLVTTDQWFIGPNGNSYRAVFGVLKGIFASDEVLGIKSNGRTANWFMQVGCMVIAGCQVYYAIQTDECERGMHVREIEHEGKLNREMAMPIIFFAD